MQSEKKDCVYQGFEQGPIRPPSEAYSLLVRATRNCPWNHCRFCPVYNDTKFSIRPKDHVKTDIDMVYEQVMMLQDILAKSGRITRPEVHQASRNLDSSQLMALNAAFNWMAGGMESIFIQDANSLIIKPSDLVDILQHLRKRFPMVKRITSYARSHTIARIKDDDLKAFKDAGLNRIHIGLESGSDDVLKMVRKGVTKAGHIKAGTKVKNAGIELSEYVMPGLGGRKLSRVHALETADALNQINPDFIRLRTLAIPNSVGLFEDWEKGIFEKCTDLEMTKEIDIFLDALNGITSIIKSDHILNLFQDIEGRLPEDKKKMLDIVNRFLALSPENQMTYQVGRRLGVFAGLDDMLEGPEMDKVVRMCRRLGVTPDNIDATIDELMKRFV